MELSNLATEVCSGSEAILANQLQQTEHLKYSPALTERARSCRHALVN
jgi:hypothetical protein